MGGKGSGRGSHKMAVDWTELQRHSAAHLLRRIRNVETPVLVKDKIAIDVAGKTIGKAVFNQTTNIQTPRSWEELLQAAEALNARRDALDAGRDRASDALGAKEQPRFVLSGDIGNNTDAVSDKTDGVSTGQ